MIEAVDVAVGTSAMRRPRWEKYDMTYKKRVHDRFRNHVRKDSNPKGRIHRESCQYCDDPHPGEAHHVDYDRTFAVVWACVSCHRKIKHGSIRVRKKDIHDYTSLVNSKFK